MYVLEQSTWGCVTIIKAGTKLLYPLLVIRANPPSRGHVHVLVSLLAQSKQVCEQAVISTKKILRTFEDKNGSIATLEEYCQEGLCC